MRAFDDGNEEWMKHQQARTLQPDHTSITLNGREWQRSHPLRCSVCKITFYGWQPIDSPFPPFEDPRGIQAPGERVVCGHPRCFQTELDIGMRELGKYAPYGMTPEPPKLVKKDLAPIRFAPNMGYGEDDD